MKEKSNVGNNVPDPPAMGHILTWLVRDLKEDGTFTLKACAEQAYSRIRGVCCTIKPKAKSNPKFWIEEEVDGETGGKTPHKEKMHGMFGYDGEVDYSNFDDLTEYVLRDFD